jgi:hypothetical protein
MAERFRTWQGISPELAEGVSETQLNEWAIGAWHDALARQEGSYTPVGEQTLVREPNLKYGTVIYGTDGEPMLGEDGEPLVDGVKEHIFVTGLVTRSPFKATGVYPMPKEYLDDAAAWDAHLSGK